MKSQILILFSFKMSNKFLPVNKKLSIRSVVSFLNGNLEYLELLCPKCILYFLLIFFHCNIFYPCVYRSDITRLVRGCQLPLIVYTHFLCSIGTRRRWPWAQIQSRITLGLKQIRVLRLTSLLTHDECDPGGKPTQLVRTT